MSRPWCLRRVLVNAMDLLLLAQLLLLLLLPLWRMKLCGLWTSPQTLPPPLPDQNRKLARPRHLLCSTEQTRLSRTTR